MILDAADPQRHVRERLPHRLRDQSGHVREVRRPRAPRARRSERGDVVHRAPLGEWILSRTRDACTHRNRLDDGACGERGRGRVGLEVGSLVVRPVGQEDDEVLGVRVRRAVQKLRRRVQPARVARVASRRQTVHRRKHCRSRRAEVQRRGGSIERHDADEINRRPGRCRRRVRCADCGLHTLESRVPRPATPSQLTPADSPMLPTRSTTKMTVVSFTVTPVPTEAVPVIGTASPSWKTAPSDGAAIATEIDVPPGRLPVQTPPPPRRRVPMLHYQLRRRARSNYETCALHPPPRRCPDDACGGSIGPTLANGAEQADRQREGLFPCTSHVRPVQRHVRHARDTRYVKLTT